MRYTYTQFECMYTYVVWKRTNSESTTLCWKKVLVREYFILEKKHTSMKETVLVLERVRDEGLSPYQIYMSW